MPRALAPVSVGLHSVAYHLPDRIETVEGWLARWGGPPKLGTAMSRNGVRTFHRADGQSALDLAVAATERVLASGVDATDIGLLIHTCTSALSIVPPPDNMAAAIARRCGLSHTHAFSVSQLTCVSSLMALKIVQAMMVRDQKLKFALIVSSDAFLPSAEPLRGMEDNGIHGDGACAVLVARNWPHNRLRSVHITTDGRSYRPLVALQNADNDSRYFWLMIATIRAALRDASVPLESVRRIFPNNANLPAWLHLLDKLKIRRDVLFTDNFGRTGHVFGCDPFINFADAGGNGDDGGFFLLYTSGLAGCYGAAVLEA